MFTTLSEARPIEKSPKIFNEINCLRIDALPQRKVICHPRRGLPDRGVLLKAMIPRGSGRWSRPALVLALYLGMAAAAVVWTSLRGQPALWRTHDHGEPWFWSSLLAGIALGLLLVFLSRLAVHRFEWARELHREFRGLLGPHMDGEIVVLALASSIGEEMFFRGALMPAVGLGISSAIFALLHIGPRLRYLPWTLGSFGAGLLFGALFLWTGDLSGAVAAHCTVNFLNLRHVTQYEPL